MTGRSLGASSDRLQPSEVSWIVTGQAQCDVLRAAKTAMAKSPCAAVLSNKQFSIETVLHQWSL